MWPAAACGRVKALITLSQVAAELAQVGGVTKLLVAEDAALAGLLPERVTPVLLAAHKQFNFSHIIGEDSRA